MTAALAAAAGFIGGTWFGLFLAAILAAGKNKK